MGRIGKVGMKRETLGSLPLRTDRAGYAPDGYIPVISSSLICPPPLFPFAFLDWNKKKRRTQLIKKGWLGLKVFEIRRSSLQIPLKVNKDTCYCKGPISGPELKDISVLP